MGIRESVNKNPGVTAAVVGALIVGVIVFIVMSTRTPGGGGGGPEGGPTQAYFSADDGQTWFADERHKPAPFSHEGKEAVRARMFSCEGGKEPFVGYVEKYSATGLQQIQKAGGDVAQLDPEARSTFESTGTLVKPPKNSSANWVAKNTPAGQAVVGAVTCPEGKTLEEVYPK